MIRTSPKGYRSLVEEIKNRLSVEDVLVEHGVIISSKRRHHNHKAHNIKCPFHDDRSPSFTVWPQTNTWKCWAGCGSGDVINLVSKLRGISNHAAILQLKSELKITNAEVETDYSQDLNDRMIIRGFMETKEKITSQLIHFRRLIHEAMKQVNTLKERDELAETGAYDYKSLITHYLEDLESENLSTQVATVKYLKPFLLEE